MTRCDYDVVFYRVFCVTLLAIAFTFTVILTNVFIDIDGLLAGKKDKQNLQLNENTIRDEFTSEAKENEELTNYGETDDSYRTKRSIETQSFLFHIKNPKIKNILANRLTTLLEELEAEEAAAETKRKEKKINEEVPKAVELVEAPKQIEEKKPPIQKDEDITHLTIHNILLQGIIEHMDLNNVYERVRSLMKNMNDQTNKREKLNMNKQEEITKVQSIDSKYPKNQLRESKSPKTIEDMFFEELVGCHELQNQVDSANTKEVPKKASTANPNLMIKTVIDITSLANDKPKKNETKASKENIKGVIEIVYNGKTMKFTRPDLEMIQTSQKKQDEVVKPKPIILKKVITESTTEKESIYYNKISKSLFNKFVEEYFKHLPKEDKETINEIKENSETKRQKRHVKMKYDNTSKEQIKKKHEPRDDELYVEIETHFDSKGLKGEKKKKLIRNLIDKIQKAIHSDMDGKLITSKVSKNNKYKQLHFKKRIQDPLEHTNHVLINKYSLPIDSVIHRQLDPISKTYTLGESSPNIGGRSGEDWRKPYAGPGFLTASKSINSAEMSEVDVDYSKVLDFNGVAQRLQRPLNTDFSEETLNTNSFYDLGDMKFFIKDIDGSGFSVGFNQYIDEPPDPDTIKLFTGLENVIKTYHQNYDPADITTDANLSAQEKNRNTSPNNDHIIMRRSINKKHDYHTNEYKIIFDENYLPYRNYRDIFETKKSKANIEFSSTNNKHVKDIPLIVDENVFEKNLNPAEIFGIANLLNRKKRSINVKKISNLKSKIKLNRYLNTKAMSTKRIFLNKKRNKRQINKIRIIATDLPHLSKHSDENFFVVSDENVFADRAIVKEVETSEMDHDKQDESDYTPYQSDDSISPSYITKLFAGRSRHNPLMAKYPHIFMEEISRSREEYIPENPALIFSKLPSFSKLTQNVDVEKVADRYVIETNNRTPNVPNVTELPISQKEEINNPLPSPNYKVTVKIVPKNITGLNSGFKEIHTSINKRINKNGLLYSSLVNVSEISKVIKLNRSKGDTGLGPNGMGGDGNGMGFKGAIVDSIFTKKIKDQQEKMQMLLKQHAQHITEQLNRLNAEKINIESIIDEENNNTDLSHTDYSDIIELSKSLKADRSNKDEKLTQNTFKETVTTSPTPKLRELTTLAYPEKTTIITEKVKNNVINTIERNENITDQILKKIDKNTEILQTFLKKLTEKLTDKVAIPTPKPENEEENVTKYQHMQSFAPPQEWGNHGMHFNQNMVIRKNESHISIPFVYAYQQPGMSNKRDTPVTNVIYHGHIHTNTIHPNDKKSSENGLKYGLSVGHKISDSNQTRFFIDELENDYKVIQVGDVKKKYNQYNNNMVNGTRIG